MTSQGPPLRFKAVNTDTGEVRAPFDLSVKHDPLSNDYGIALRRLSDPVFDFNVEICQSTGLHDARGVEIFFGDVLLSDVHGFNTVVWDPVDCECRLQNDAGAISYINSDTSKECNTRVIGNRHESREVLEQREKEVIGGA